MSLVSDFCGPVATWKTLWEKKNEAFKDILEYAAGTRAVSTHFLACSNQVAMISCMKARFSSNKRHWIEERGMPTPPCLVLVCPTLSLRNLQERRPLLLLRGHILGLSTALMFIGAMSVQTPLDHRLIHDHVRRWLVSPKLFPHSLPPLRSRELENSAGDSEF